jgi:hypothetical protein
MSLSTARWTAVLGSAVVLLFSSAMPASAVIIGTLETGSGGTITYTATSITINTDPSSNPAGPPWNGEVANGTSLMFAGCPSGVLGTAGCLDASPNSPNEAIEFAKNTPITGVLAANNPFVQFAGNGTSHANLLFTVTAIGPGSANTNCAGAVNVGDSCSPFPGSPLVLTKTAVVRHVRDRYGWCRKFNLVWAVGKSVHRGDAGPNSRFARHWVGDEFSVGRVRRGINDCS